MLETHAYPFVRSTTSFLEMKSRPCATVTVESARRGTRWDIPVTGFVEKPLRRVASRGSPTRLFVFEVYFRWYQLLFGARTTGHKAENNHA
jgi:hypothetical protein